MIAQRQQEGDSLYLETMPSTSYMYEQVTQHQGTMVWSDWQEKRRESGYTSSSALEEATANRGRECDSYHTLYFSEVVTTLKKLLFTAP